MMLLKMVSWGGGIFGAYMGTGENFMVTNLYSSLNQGANYIRQFSYMAGNDIRYVR
jgi:hypothetical protein